MEKSTLKSMKFGKEKLRNIWFFYKWQIIAGILILAVCGGMLVQCVSKDDADIYIYWAGPTYFSGDAQKNVCEAFEAVIPDDCGETVGLVTTVFGSDISVGSTDKEKEQYVIDYTGKQESVSEFKNQMRLPNTVICILSPVCFDLAVKDGNTLRKLSEVFDKPVEGTTEDGFGILLSSLPFYESNSILKNFPLNSVLCLKSSSVFRSDGEYEKQVEAFRAIVLWSPQT